MYQFPAPRRAAAELVEELAIALEECLREAGESEARERVQKAKGKRLPLFFDTAGLFFGKVPIFFEGFIDPRLAPARGVGELPGG